MYLVGLHGQATSAWTSPCASTNGIPTEWTQGTKAPSVPSWSKIARPIRVMIRMLTTT